MTCIMLVGQRWPTGYLTTLTSRLGRASSHTHKLSSHSALQTSSPKTQQYTNSSHSVYLLTAGDGELAGRGAPLPPRELYNAARPQAGLLPMLMAALWQVLWADAAPGAGAKTNSCKEYQFHSQN